MGPRGSNHLPGERSKNLPERGQYNWTLKRNRSWPGRKEKKGTSCRDQHEQEAEAGAQGGKLSTVHSLAECSQANFLCLSLSFFLFKTEVKMRCSTLNKVISRSKMGHRGKGAL